MRSADCTILSLLGLQVLVVNPQPRSIENFEGHKYNCWCFRASQTAKGCGASWNSPRPVYSTLSVGTRSLKTLLHQYKRHHP